jgi:lipopolysaccharide export system permease protein
MHVLASSGMGPRGLLKPVAILAGIIVLVTGLVSLWLGPWAVRTSDALVAEANRSVIAAGLDAGRFTELPGKGGIIFVESLNRDGSVLGKTFVATESVDKDGTRQIKLVTAAGGQLYQESNGEGRFMALRDGWQYKIPLGRDDWWRMQYARNDVALSEVKADDEEDPAHSQGTWALATSASPDARAEFAWRVHAPPMAFVLLMLALPLSRQSPREPRYGRVMLALLGFYLYYLLLALGRAQIGKGHWANSLPLLVVHLLALALALWLFWKQYAPRKPRDAHKAVA